jgi:hypothetical protein
MASDDNPATTSQFFTEVGFGYLGCAGGFLGGCALGGIIVPRTDEHMGAAFPVAYAGYSLGSAGGVFLWGEKNHVKSTNPELAFGAAVLGAALPVTLGYIANSFGLFALGTALGPFSSAALYNLVKKPEHPAKGYSISFSIRLF